MLNFAAQTLSRGLNEAGIWPLIVLLCFPNPAWDVRSGFFGRRMFVSHWDNLQLGDLCWTQGLGIFYALFLLDSFAFLCFSFPANVGIMMLIFVLREDGVPLNKYIAFQIDIPKNSSIIQSIGRECGR